MIGDELGSADTDGWGKVGAKVCKMLEDPFLYLFFS